MSDEEYETLVEKLEALLVEDLENLGEHKKQKTQGGKKTRGHVEVANVENAPQKKKKKEQKEAFAKEKKKEKQKMMHTPTSERWLRCEALAAADAEEPDSRSASSWGPNGNGPTGKRGEA